jgi:hypothetical protein
MAPHILASRSSFNASTTRHELREQFINPSDVFSVLLIVGPDVITQALAQLAGGALTPVTLASAGWHMVYLRWWLLEARTSSCQSRQMVRVL